MLSPFSSASPPNCVSQLTEACGEVEVVLVSGKPLRQEGTTLMGLLCSRLAWQADGKCRFLGSRVECDEFWEGLFTTTTESDFKESRDV